MADENGSIRIERDGPVARVVLHRPRIHNAFDDSMLAEMTEAFGLLGAEETVRVVVVTGAGQSFCAGADLAWMKRVVAYGRDENLEDARRLAACLHGLYTLPKPTIARVNGAAIGGGVGLLAACDIAVASAGAFFALREVRLGLAPAVISPFLVRRIGEAACRELFLTGERIDAVRAGAIGLVRAVVPSAGLDGAVARYSRMLEAGGPEALAACKRLLETVPAMHPDAAGPFTADLIARLRAGEEGQEGMLAFLEKRRPRWRGEDRAEEGET